MMVSSGIRIGALDYLRWRMLSRLRMMMGESLLRNLQCIPGSGKTPSSIHPEAHFALKDWMDFRASYGEAIPWRLRDACYIWYMINIDYGAKLGLATCPKKLKSSGIKRIIERALWKQAIGYLQDGKKRHEWKELNGFRKFDKTHAEQVMRPINVEITMGHDIGVSASYYKPTGQEVLEDYLKAVDSLTINNAKTVLTKQVAELKQKNIDNEYVIRGKLQEKDEQVKNLTVSIL